MADSVYKRFGRTNIGGTASSGIRHTVRGGDTLWGVAALYYEGEGFSSEAWRQIAEENDIDDIDDIEVGDVWVIPTLRPRTE